ncbi:MAG TPA: dihydropteroate synthase [Opitutaceae bacterium]|nr:dihydropteroate synthase [Opitutaceae bacterium]
MTQRRPIRIIGELINNAYGRARRAWEARDVEAYQQLARLQSDAGAAAVNVNIDGTQRIAVRTEEMLDFLPELIPALQAATDVPLSFDSPNIEYHRTALAAFDRTKSRQKPVLNSLAASRHRLHEMVALVRENDMRCIVMASEKFLPDGGSAQNLTPQDCHETVRRFAELLVTQANRSLDDIIVDPGLAPVGADTYGLVSNGLDTMRLCRNDPELQGIHFSVGLSNFAWGTPKRAKPLLERAYLTIAGRIGLDMALANVESNATPLPDDDPLVTRLEDALERGRAAPDESVEEAGFRQASLVMELCSEFIDE